MPTFGASLTPFLMNNLKERWRLYTPPKTKKPVLKSEGCVVVIGLGGGFWGYLFLIFQNNDFAEFFPFGSKF